MTKLEAVKDLYGGVVVDAEKVPTDASTFDQSLQSSLDVRIKSACPCHILHSC